MKPRDYCCCAIPTVKVGIYAVLTEQLVLGIVLGTLAVAAPDIVGSDSFTAWPFAIVCYAVAGIQILGFIGVLRDSPITFRRYTTLHIFVTLGAFGLSAAMIGLSAGRHSTVKSHCLTEFFPANSTGTSTSNLGDTLCNIFPWVDVGVMGGLWILLAISQFYFYTVVSGYGTFQRDYGGKYDSVASFSNLAGGDIPMAKRLDPWDARGSEELLRDSAGQHGRSDSNASRFDTEPYTDAPAQPLGAHTHRATPTPHEVHFGSRGYGDQYYSSNNETADVNRPEQYQPHPAEGSFGRKTPRLHKPARYNGLDFSL
ncbi:hypothetical protein K488DRAFT_45884 [Vararia minispora EC-137]|uniref:Uncharacterized protein n=1 Tax=Vararia minispora EC-137 TaxID=1314806 RepID=A0ACB8QRL0_9AGAM|nr:hypothetical protein K488DRAFT_45884 [Vararia minispora EC-137]